MIAFLTGRLAHVGAGYALLDVGGVGYRLNMTTGSLAALPAEGDEVTVHTYLHVREDELTLFGFESVAEKHAFEQLITVSGVGPKVALATLSALTPEALSTAVATEDIALISSVPGVGKKTAQRICLDLADKLGGEPGSGSGSRGVRSGGAASAVAEVTDALLGMGFSAAEIGVAMQGADSADRTEALLAYALKRLGGGA
jgi:Holliday junction DNA helicase RuvA